MAEQPLCELCGEPMPPGEEMFKFHGYSGRCPAPLKTQPTPEERAQTAYNIFRGGFRDNCPVPHWDHAPSWVRDVVRVAYLQGKLDGR